MSVHSLWLLRVGGSAETRRRLHLNEGQPLLVGRAGDCDVIIPDRVISKHHAELRREGLQTFVRDLGSRNGTVVIRGGEERLLGAEQEAEIKPDSAVRVADYLLVPCESLASNVSLSASPAFDTPLPGEMTSHTLNISADVQLAARGRAHERICEIVTQAGREEIWEKTLAEFVELMGACRGFILSISNARFVLRAQVGDNGAYCLSQSFLEETLRRESVFSYVIGEDNSAENLGSESLMEYPMSTRLVGVPLFGRERRPVGVCCLEITSAQGPGNLDVVVALAELAGPILQGLIALDREVRRRTAAEERLEESAGTRLRDEGTGLVGRSPAFRHVVDAVHKAAPSTATILVRGPSGSGKEGLARLAHRASPRRDHPLVTLNCASIPSELVESELFGSDKGAFTGADVERVGAFERAHGGTLFLDEIGDLALAAQASVLRSLETGEIVRVGGSLRRVDVRLVAATHRDLEAMVKAGSFRSDLYYRLKVIEVTLPPLRERPEDIVPLARHFLHQFRRPDGVEVAGLSTAAARVLAGYAWPGNIRELRNVIERAVVLDRDGIIARDDLPRDLQQEPGSKGNPEDGEVCGILETDWTEAKRQFSEIYFRRALTAHGGRVQETAEAVGVTRRTLSMKIKEHDLRADS